MNERKLVPQSVSLSLWNKVVERCSKLMPSGTSATLHGVLRFPINPPGPNLVNSSRQGRGAHQLGPFIDELCQNAYRDLRHRPGTDFDSYGASDAF